ncbi:hypothetical protein SteCoe_23855 [Stentor coeruleus]|uniref:Uncharacterized protein n=1 Tax=Stentor coeruleus TaxID=5963 RepID=A0A1R2BIV0_9CILI|nr:hypothetical protein SteCoe_23855 [Stentor coeruleus]
MHQKLSSDDKLKSEVKELQKILEQADSKCKQLENEITKCNTIIQDKQAEIKQYEAALQSKQMSLDQASVRIKALESDINNIQASKPEFDNFKEIFKNPSSDEQVIMKTDASFLNSFLSNIETIIAVKLQNWIKSLYVIDTIEIWRPEKLFPINNDDALKLLVSNHCNEDTTEENIEEIIEKCKIELIKIAPADILVIIENASITIDEKQFIRNKWRELHDKAFYKFLEEIMESNQWNKFMVMTYQVERVGKIFTGNTENFVCVKQFTSFKSDREFDKDMQAFIQSKYKMCIIELDFSIEHQHMNYLKYKVENLLKEFDKENEKKICLVVVLSRRIDYPKAVPLYREWYQIMFDELETQNKELGAKDKRAQFKITDDLLKLSTKEIILRSDIFNFKENISYIIENALMKFNPVNYPVSDYDAYINCISINIYKEIELIELFESKVIDYFKNNSDLIEDWKKCIFTDKEICDQSRDAKSALFNYISSILEEGILKLVFQMEKAQAFSSYFYSSDDDISCILKDIWRMNFEKFCIEQNMKLQKLTSSNQIEKFKFALNFPFSTIEFKKISEFYATYSNSSLDKNAKENFKESLDKNSVTGKYIEYITEIQLMVNI